MKRVRLTKDQERYHEDIVKARDDEGGFRFNRHTRRVSESALRRHYKQKYRVAKELFSFDGFEACGCLPHRYMSLTGMRSNQRRYP